MNKIREKLVLTKEQANEILWEDAVGFDIVSNEITENTRWSIVHKIILKRLSDNKFFADIYSMGATESQDERPWAYHDPNFEEVFPVNKIITVYE